MTNSAGQLGDNLNLLLRNQLFKLNNKMCGWVGRDCVNSSVFVNVMNTTLKWERKRRLKLGGVIASLFKDTATKKQIEIDEKWKTVGKKKEEKKKKGPNFARMHQKNVNMPVTLTCLKYLFAFVFMHLCMLMGGALKAIQNNKANRKK